VKIRPLPEIDLARIAPLPRDQKRNALEQIRLGHPPYSYAPIRASASDVLNVQSELIGPMPRTPWEKIQETIVKRSTSDSEEQANLRVAQGLFTYIDRNRIVGRRHDIFPLALGVGSKVVYWQPVVLNVHEQPTIPFLDPRRAKALTAEGRRFVLSVMHERIRVADPDFAGVSLAVIQFSLSEKGPRIPLVYTDESVKLFTFDQLDQMVRETYELWQEVCEGRVEEIRRRAAGKGDGFI